MSDRSGSRRILFASCRTAPLRPVREILPGTPLPLRERAPESHFYPTTNATMDDMMDIDDTGASAAQRAVNEKHRLRIDPKTRRGYSRKMQKFLDWLIINHPERVVDGRIDLDNLTANEFELFLNTLKGRKGVRASHKTMSGYKSGLVCLYKTRGNHDDGKTKMKENMKESLASFLQGAQKMDAQEAQDGTRSAGEGKSPLPYNVFALFLNLILTYTIVGGVGPAVLAHCYYTLTWNLMCRSKNTSGLKFSHLSWQGDALCVHLPQMKNDQCGKRPKDPRHVYANPLQPAVCPILSLGVYLLCNPEITGKAVFPGGSQYSRVLKYMKKIFVSASDDLARHGLTPDCLGVHSLRKGAATYVTSGNVGGPSIVPVSIRCGWSLGGVQDRYLRYEHAGDQYVGRVVAGLDLSSADFCILPPHFIDSLTSEQKKVVDTVILTCFPSLFPRVQLRGVLIHLLASVIFHEKYLRNTLSANHPLLQSPLFTRAGFLTQLSPWVETGMNASGTLRATGIPPSVHLMTQVNKLEEMLTTISSELNYVPARVAARTEVIVTQALTNAGVMGQAAYALTDIKEVITGSMIELLQQLGVSTQHHQQQQQPQEQQEPQQQPTYRYHSWSTDSAWHRIPEGFVLPSSSIGLAWSLWWYGDSDRSILPYRCLSSADFPAGSMARKTLSSWKCVFEFMERRVRASDSGEWFGSRPTDAQLRSMYDAAVILLPRSSESLGPNGTVRVRRPEQLAVTTLAKEIRKGRKRRVREE